MLVWYFPESIAFTSELYVQLICTESMVLYSSIICITIGRLRYKAMESYIPIALFIVEYIVHAKKKTHFRKINLGRRIWGGLGYNKTIRKLFPICRGCNYTISARLLVFVGFSLPADYGKGLVTNSYGQLYWIKLLLQGNIKYDLSSERSKHILI